MTKAKNRKKPHTFAECQTDEERSAYFKQRSAFDLLEQGLMEEESLGVRYKKKPRKNQQLNIRVEADLLETIKGIALEKGLAYQTLVRMWIQEKVKQEEFVSKKM